MQNYLILTFLAVSLLLSGCMGNSSQTGGVENNSYQSDAQNFSLKIPQGAKVSGGQHALGKYVVIRGLPKPIEIKGVSYNRVANVEEGTSQEAKNGIVKTGHDFWAKTYTGSELNVIHSEWVDLDGMSAYFTVLESAPVGLLVKPNLFYGTLSFLKGGYSYVLFARERTDKELLGNKEQPAAANPENRVKSISAFYYTVTFH